MDIVVNRTGHKFFPVIHSYLQRRYHIDSYLILPDVTYLIYWNFIIWGSAGGWQDHFAASAKLINSATHGNKSVTILSINQLNSSSYISVANSITCCSDC
jgi:hypothetical protein